MSNAPIAVFDSGLGGLTVWSELFHRLPNESLIYYGDGKNCPYGDQTPEQVRVYVDFAVQRLLERGVKMVVVACNAATSMSIDYLRETYPGMPFIGLEPAVKPAAEASRSGVIGILATSATLKGRYFKESLRRHSDQVRVIARVGEGFVELVEGGLENTPQALAQVSGVVEPMLEQGVDQLVLGCTHYPFLTQTLQKVIGERAVQLIDPALAVQRRVESLLNRYDLRAEADHHPQYDYLTSSDEVYRQYIIQKAATIQSRNHPNQPTIEE